MKSSIIFTVVTNSFSILNPKESQLRTPCHYVSRFSFRFDASLVGFGLMLEVDFFLVSFAHLTAVGHYVICPWRKNGIDSPTFPFPLSFSFPIQKLIHERLGTLAKTVRRHICASNKVKIIYITYKYNT